MYRSQVNKSVTTVHNCTGNKLHRLLHVLRLHLVKLVWYILHKFCKRISIYRHCAAKPKDVDILCLH